MDKRERLVQGLQELGISFPAEFPKRCLDFLEFLEKWNQYHNLTAIREVDDMVSGHLLDSLSIAPYLQGDLILDVGSGAGFPGIPLALLFSTKRFILLDSRSKKTAFLVQAISHFQIPNVTVVSERMESYRPNECMDAIICRAVGTVADIIQHTEALLCSGGRWLIMKGVYPREELETISYPLLVHRLRVPGMEAERHVVEILSLLR